MYHISFPIKVSIFIRNFIVTIIFVSSSYVADMASTPELILWIKSGPALSIGVTLLSVLFLYCVTP